MPKPLAVIVAFTLVGYAWAADPKPPVEVKLAKGVYKEGEAITLTVTGNGTFALESDVSKTSRELVVKGETKVELGKASEPGLYLVRIGKGSEWATIGLLVTPGEKGTVEATATPTIGTQPEKADAKLITRLIDGATKDRLKTAATEAFKKWLPNNVAALGKNGLACGLCVVPGGQFACSTCAVSTGENALGLALAVATELVNQLEKDKVITKEEAKYLRGAFTATGGLVSLITADGKVEKLLAAIKTAGEVVIEHEGAKMILNNGTDQAGKAMWLIKATKGK